MSPQNSQIDWKLNSYCLSYSYILKNSSNFPSDSKENPNPLLLLTRLSMFWLLSYFSRLFPSLSLSVPLSLSSRSTGLLTVSWTHQDPTLEHLHVCLFPLCLSCHSLPTSFRSLLKYLLLRGAIHGHPSFHSLFSSLPSWFFFVILTTYIVHISLFSNFYIRLFALEGDFIYFVHFYILKVANRT